MKNRKISAALAAAVMSLTIGVSAWAAEDQQTYTFTTGNVQLATGQEWNKAHKELGGERCFKILTEYVNGGNIIAYIYDDCEIRTTRNMKKKAIIDSIELKGTASTEEGLSLGQPAEDVKKIYPSATEEQGLYVAELGDSRILIDCGVENKKVLSIEYQFAGKK